MWFYRRGFILYQKEARVRPSRLAIPQAGQPLAYFLTRVFYRLIIDEGLFKSVLSRSLRLECIISVSIAKWYEVLLPKKLYYSILQRGHLTDNHKMCGTVQQCRQTYQSFRSSVGRHRQHGWNRVVRRRVRSLDRAAAWSQSWTWEGRHYCVSMV